MEQTFRAPNFYSREVDESLVNPPGPFGTPYAIVGSSPRGPAFVPYLVGTESEFTDAFGAVDRRWPATFAARERLSKSNALYFVRVLGAGANSTSSDIATTLATGRVRNAGFKLEGILAPSDTRGRHSGAVQFIAAKHTVRTDESGSYPLFTRAASTFALPAGAANLVRAVVFTASGSRVMLLDGSEAAPTAFTASPDDLASVVSGSFKLIVSSSDGATFGSSDGLAGLRIYSASLDPSSANYIGKLLNRDPAKFAAEQHLLWADFAVDDEVATATAVGVLSGSATVAGGAAESVIYRHAFGGYDSRFSAPETTWFISQPYGGVEYDLFKLQAVDDGDFANFQYKVTIRDVRASLDASRPYGTFTILIRRWDDTDTDPVVLEQFPLCSLDPDSPNFVAKRIGDRRARFEFDALLSSERRVSVTGKYPNQSKLVRVSVSDAVSEKLVPASVLPFGFRGFGVLKTNDTLTDSPSASALTRLVGYLGTSTQSTISGAVVPPVPFRQKLTRGLGPQTPAWLGQPSSLETVVPSLTWGVKFERNTVPRNSNVTSEPNRALAAYARFTGLEKLDVLVTGSGADSFCSNKFSLSRVVLSNGSLAHLTSSPEAHVREAAYWRDAQLDPNDLTLVDPTLGKRITLGTVLALGTPQQFNKFSLYAKFTTLMRGGFDGTNVLDASDYYLNDRAASMDAGGSAASGYVPTGFSAAQAGTGVSNSAVASYRVGVDVATDQTTVDAHVFAVPGIREPYVTDYAASRAKTHAATFYLMEIPSYDSSGNRLFADSSARPSVSKTADSFAGRTLDNSYAAAYFPDAFLTDDAGRSAKMPATVAVLGAMSNSDRVGFPWSAPAGYNRTALPQVANVSARLTPAERDALSDVRINPIASSPSVGFAVMGQKTLQLRRSALDRINVRRTLVEAKRAVVAAARTILFEQNDAETRSRLKRELDSKMGFIQAQGGFEDFRVIVDESNNTPRDVDLNTMNCAIRVRPVRSIEYVSIDFIITRSGVEFQ